MSEQFIGKIIAGKYRVDSRLNNDAYFGRHSFTEKPVILKLLPAAADQEVAESFTGDARAASHISHPNFLGVTDFGTDSSGDLYTAFEGVEGESLATALERDKPVPAAVALDVAAQVASGLSAAHKAGIVHGNLSPHDVLISYAPAGSKQVKVFNFGTSNPMASVRDLDYLSPEQCSGSEFPDQRSDVYSLGVILYEMLAGERPFGGDSPSELIRKHSEEPPPPLSAFRSDLAPGIEPIVVKALSKDPEMRFQSADEFAEALSLQQMALGTAPEAAPANNLWKTAFVVLAGISLLSVFLIYATSVTQTDPATALQPDANGQPVQPINPATGVEEQSLATLPGAMDLNGNTNSMTDPVPGGDGYNPWANGGAPPAGAPLQPGGGTVTVSPGQSQFMSDANCIMQPSGLLLCPVPVTPTPTPKATPTPKTPPVSANTSPVAVPTPDAKPQPKATPTPAKPSADKPKPGTPKPADGEANQ